MTITDAEWDDYFQYLDEMRRGPTLDVQRLREAVKAIPDHYAGGYEWEWDCAFRLRSGDTFPECQPGEPEHDHQLISRERVLALLEVPA